MDKIDWMEVAKISAAVLSALAAVIGFFWKWQRTLRRRINQLAAQNKEIRKQRDRLKTAEQGLKAKHKSTRELWRTKITAAIERIRTYYRTQLADKERILKSLSSQVAKLKAMVGHQSKQIERL